MNILILVNNLIFFIFNQLFGLVITVRPLVIHF